MWQRMAQVREAVRSFRMEKAVWVTWKPRLERLLTQLDDQAVKTFLAEMPGLALLREEEMRKTIEAFLRLDLNISETARHLYVHRNTLLYRFDRVKQETGLDVRRFADAMLIKVVLLLLNHQEGER
jgi:DNA-binding PucR family transcriptional regulator